MLKRKLIGFNGLSLILPEPRQGLVLTTGVYDLLHVGHPRYLNEARNLGQKLIVVLHGDKLVKERKGKERPFYKEMERAEMLSYFPFIDYLLIGKDQKEVYQIIDLIRPEILVVSETTEDKENNPETMRKLFGEKMKVVTLGKKSKRHSSHILKKIKG